jgi:splicing factor 3A subunit 2
MVFVIDLGLPSSSIYEGVSDAEAATEACVHRSVGALAAAPKEVEEEQQNQHQFLVETPHGNTACLTLPLASLQKSSYTEFVSKLLHASRRRDLGNLSKKRSLEQPDDIDDINIPSKIQRPCNSTRILQVIHQGKVLDPESYRTTLLSSSLPCSPCRFKDPNNRYNTSHYLSFRVPILGGIDRQNRVGSKFGGGGVSSGQNAERERKERLKKLALESIDLAKDPYLMRNHLGTYECKLCLTLHTNEANYLAHTQGKKHQQGLAKRAHMEKLRAERDGGMGGIDAARGGASKPAAPQQQQLKVRIGRPAYQVFKSRDPDTNQRCLSFELAFPEVSEGIQPRHRFMSAFEQRVEIPPDRWYQYLLFAAEPYETVAFKIPNEPLDKGEGRFVTHWNVDEKKLTVTLYLMEPTATETTKPFEQGEVEAAPKEM